MIVTSSLYANINKARNIIVKKEIKVYSIPLSESDDIQNLEKNGILERKIVNNQADSSVYTDKKLVIVFDKKNLTNNKKIQLLLDALDNLVNKSNIKDKSNFKSIIQVLKSNLDEE
jgi:Tfp pilus assembly protein FimT